jgi:hypothetical protein
VEWLDYYFESDILTPGEWDSALLDLQHHGYKIQKVGIRRRYDPGFPLGRSGQPINIKMFPDEGKEEEIGDADVFLYLEGEYKIAEEV